ncbi:MAG: hypothetical protein WCQ91_08805, partial [Planctomycetota bacterium]
TREYQVTKCVPETMTKEVSCTVMVPQQKEVKYTVVAYDCVPETKTASYTVRVPHQVTKEVAVKVCRMVAVEVPVTNACGNCGEPAACCK